MSDSLERKISDMEMGKRSQQALLSGGDLVKVLEGRASIPEKREFTLDAIPVVVSFPSGNISGIIAAFVDLGGKLKSWYDVAINGFAGTISQEGLDAFCSNLRKNNVPFLVEEDGIVRAQLYYASRNMNLRPLAWSTYGFRGDPSTAVAVIDTGIDDSHAMFAPGYSSGNGGYKITGWSDQVSGVTTPYDDNGHGSHCSGIVAGSGNYSLDGSNRAVATYSMGYDYTGYYIPSQTISITAARFNVTNPGTIDIDCTFTDSTSGDRVYIRAYLYRGETVVDSYVSTATSWTDTLTIAAAAGTLGDYSLRLEMQFYGADGYCDNPVWRFRGIVHWPFSAPALGSNNRWQGVAPDSRLVGIKVLSASGSGTLSDIVDGINWAITNRMVYNITVISMSLGGSGGQTSMITAVNNAVNSGIVTVVAAGNDGSGADNIGSPGDADNVITVAAMSDADRVTDFSSQGGPSYTGYTNKPDLMAPGGSYYNFSMFSVDTNDNDAETFMTEGFTNDMAPMLGTSMATPAVAGAANLVIDALGGRQNWNFTGNEAKLVKALLLMTATETYPLQREVDTSYSPLLNRGGKDVHEGYGRINVDAAIEACINDVQITGSITHLLSSSATSSLSKHAIGGHVHLMAGIQYYISLDVPVGADFDLHLYNGSSSAYGEPVQVASSTSTLTGQDELISFTPSRTGIYYVVAKAISGSGNATLDVAGNDFAPALTLPSVSPMTGNQTTPFNFSVIYTDIDDNSPALINVNLNGTSYPLVKQNPADFNYTDGCAYQRIVYLQPGSYLYNFSCFDGRFSNSTSTIAGPTVVAIPSTHAPLLASGNVTPTTGQSQTTMFTFMVTYSDQDNDPADYIRVIINGSTHQMVKVDPGDSNYIDGCVFSYSTLLWAGGHVFSFSCSDGVNSSAIGPFFGPMVSAQTLGGLRNYIMTPGTAYSWLDATLGIRCSMNGADDSYQAVSLPFPFTFYGTNYSTIYICSNGFVSFSPSSSYSNVAFPTSSPTLMIAPFWEDLRCESTCNIFYRSFTAPNRFVVEYQNYYTLGGTLVGTFEVVLYQTGDIYFNYDIVSAVTGQTVGLNYGLNLSYYNLYTGLYAGLNDFSILFRYPRNTYPPTLTGMSITPGSGNQATLFSFDVTYTDLDNNAPQFINVLLNNTPVSMSKVNTGDTVYTDGCAYRYQGFLSPGVYNYSFECADGGYYTATGVVTGLNVIYTNSYSPELAQGRSVPGKGYGNITPVTYSVVYTDLDNNAPAFITVIVDGTACAMVKSIPADTNYMDGCTYIYTTTLASGLSHRYSFNCSDGSNVVNTTTAYGPMFIDISDMAFENGIVAFYPLETSASDYSGYNRNGIPSGMNYQVGAFGNSGIFTGASYIDTTVANGATSYSLCALFRANSFLSNSYIDSPIIDSDRASYYGTGMGVSSTTISMVINNLYFTHPYSFLTGLWYYLVVTFDRQNNLVTSYVNGTMIQQTTVVFSTPTLVNNFFIGRDPAYNYYFNGLIDEVRIYNRTLSGIEVVELMNRINNIRPPALTGDSVNPLTGTQNTLFTFNVTYTDADNNAPQYVNLVVNATNFPMEKVNSADSIYTDGCIYTVSLYLQPGTYEYYFSCNDYGFSIITPLRTGLVVNSTNMAAPILSNARVSPTRGTNTTQFVFIVTYTDADNNMPAFISVTINATEISMSEVDVYDTNAMDGKAYQHSTTLAWGLYRFQINCSDGTFTNASTWVDAPEVNPFLAIPPQYSLYQTWGGSGTEYPYGSWADANYIYTTGYTTSYGVGGDMVLVKWDRSGNVIWYRTWGGSSIEYGYGVCGDGTYIYTAGRTNSYGAGEYDFALVKWDTSGNVIWYRTWGGTGTDYAWSVAVNGSAVYVGGYTTSYGAGLNDFALVKWDTSGNFLWYRTWGGASDDYVYGVSIYANLIYLSGITYSYGAGGDLAFVTWDNNGVFQWYRTWGGSGYEISYKIFCDGINLYAVGYTNSYGAGSYDFLLQCWSMGGVLEWYRTWGGTSADYAMSLQFFGSDIYLCGSGYNSITASMDLAIVRWNKDGMQTWSAWWGGSGTDNGRSIVIIENEIFALSETYSYGTGTPNFALVKYTIGFKPQLTTPANGITIFNGNTIFLWTSLNSALTGPLTFTWQASNTSNFSSIALQYTSIPEQASTTSALLDIDLQTGAYYWRVLPTLGIFRGIYSDPRLINVIRNDFTPALVNASVSPASGDQFTTFVFNVTYVDQDNNQPTSTFVYINGTAYAMAKQDVGDVNYTDGCIYLYATNFQHITSVYNFAFSCSDGKFSNATEVYSGPTVVESNTRTPQLLSPSVSPLSGTNTTIYTFSVVYLDLDNNLPTSITVTINASTFSMIQMTPIDTNVLDGKSYYYSTTLPWGIYRFQINCSDGTFSNNTIWINAPEANPFNDLKSSVEITNVAIFRDQLPWGYNVVAPRLTSLGIAYTVYGSSSLGVVSLAPFDKVVIESQQTTAFYNVLTQASVRAWLESYVSSGGILEMHHYHYTSDYITGTLPGGYTETQNQAGTVTVNASYTTHPIVSGVTGETLSYWSVTTISYLNNLVNHEARIIYDTSVLQPRLITRSFGSGLMIYVALPVEYGVYNGYGSYSTLLTNLLLYGENVNTIELHEPDNGSAFFNGNIDFVWSSLEPPFAPLTYHWQLSNTSSFTTILDEVLNIPEITGNTILTRNIDQPTGLYYWRVRPEYSVFHGNWSAWSYFTCIRNYFTPSLSGTVSPSTGNQLTTFNFTVTYTDADDNPPAWIHVRINGTAYSMSKVNVTDINYADGVVYQYSTILPPGVCEYEYSCGDGRFNATAGPFTNLTVIEVNYFAPSLSIGQVSPASGINGTTIFTFSVVYTDADNNYPGHVNVSINWWTFPMVKLNPADINYMDGCVYIFSTTLDANWNYEYWFNCTDRTYFASLGPFQGPIVNFPSINWTRTRNIANDNDYALATCSDGTYVYTAGYGYGIGAGGYDILLIKWDQNGNEIWYRTWGGTGTEYGYAIWSDGTNLYVVGYTNSYGAGNYDIVLVKWSTDGTFQWYRTWGTSYADYGYGVTGDGTYIYATGVAGASSYNGAVLVKWDTGGALQWSQTWGGSYYEYGRDVYVSGSNVYITGETNSYGAGSYDLFLACWTTSGSYQWYRTWGTTYADYGYGLAGDGTYIYASGVAGASSYNNLLLVKWDASGNQQWYQTWGGSYYEYGYDVLVSGTRVFIAGYTNSFGAGVEDFLLVEYTTAGTFVKYTTWGTSQTEIARGICKVGDSLFIAGYCYVSGTYYDVMLVKCYYGTPPASLSLIAPPTGSSFLCGNITFSWTSIAFSLGMVNYTWQLSTSASFTTIAMEVTGIVGSSGSTSTTLFINVTTGLYYWRVAPSFGRYTGKWAAPFSINLVRNFMPPTLTGASYTPATGHQMTDFTFQVVYTDRENNPALYVFVIINSTTYLMTKANVSDTNYADGCVYVFSTKLLIGTYNFSFSCSDGRFTNSTVTFTGLVVHLENLYAPTMGSQQVTPTTGTVATLFTFSVIYYDNDNLSAAFVRIVVDMSVHDMTKQNPADLNYIDGVMYVYSTTLEPGVHQYLFMCSDGNFSLNYGPFGGPIVDSTGGGGSAPTLTSASVTPSSGDQATNFQFSVTYTDVDNNAPFVMNVIVNGTSHPMVKLISTDLTYTDGCVYIYSTTLAPGNYNYQFVCSDGTFSAVTIVFTNLIVVYTPNLPPVLNAPAVTPTAGSILTTFRFSVIYVDPENAAPVALNVIINSVAISMSKANPGDLVYSDGCEYEYQTTLAVGIYSFSFNCSDGYNGASTETFLGLQVVDAAPMLMNLAVSPTSGSITTTFLFTITYIDGENQAPTFVTLYIDGTPYPMSKQDVGDITYTDGCIYQYGTMLPTGSHSYSASCSDGRTTVSTSTIPGLLVTNAPPTLTMPSVSPPSGSIITTFIFTVRYTDSENQAPTQINVSIDGIHYAMSKQNPSDTVYSDGCIYQLITTLVEGVHSYSFSCSDGLNPVTTATSIVEAINYAPVLANAGVTPSSGNNLTIFQFSTIYSDQENQAPAFVRILINLAVFDLVKVDANDTNFSDGCLYGYTTILDPGTYNFTFTASDGNTQVFSSIFYGFLVSSTHANRPPVLSIGQITVDSQGDPASCTFRVCYMDGDNDAPTYVQAIIDGVLFAMAKERPEDTSYVDGCTYTCIAYLVPGTHTYQFIAMSAGINATTGLMSILIPEPARNLTETAVMQNVLIISIILATIVLLAIIAAKSGNNVKKANIPSNRRNTPAPSIATKSRASKSKMKSYSSDPGAPGTEIPIGQDEIDDILGDTHKTHASKVHSPPTARGIPARTGLMVSSRPSAASKPIEGEMGQEKSTSQVSSLKAGLSPPASRGQQSIHPIPVNANERAEDLMRANAQQLDSAPAKWKIEHFPAKGSTSTINVQPFIVPLPIIIDDVATNQLLREASPILVDGKEIDIISDLRSGDVSMYKMRWYHGPPEGLEAHFLNEIIAPRIDIFGKDVPLSAIISIVRAMIYIIHGSEDPVKNQDIRRTAIQQLINFGAVDPKLPAPHLTDKGLALRVLVLELSPEQAKMIAKRDFTKIDDNL
ncbi:MAG: S8 family serine peptidase [Candidatus Sigynarchaeota archaeon]